MSQRSQTNCVETPRSFHATERNGQLIRYQITLPCPPITRKTLHPVPYPRTGRTPRTPGTGRTPKQAGHEAAAPLRHLPGPVRIPAGARLRRTQARRDRQHERRGPRSSRPAHRQEAVRQEITPYPPVRVVPLVPRVPLVRGDPYAPSVPYGTRQPPQPCAYIYPVIGETLPESRHSSRHVLQKRFASNHALAGPIPKRPKRPK